MGGKSNAAGKPPNLKSWRKTTSARSWGARRSQNSRRRRQHLRCFTVSFFKSPHAPPSEYQHVPIPLLVVGATNESHSCKSVGQIIAGSKPNGHRVCWLSRKESKQGRTIGLHSKPVYVISGGVQHECRTASYSCDTPHCRVRRSHKRMARMQDA